MIVLMAVYATLLTLMVVAAPLSTTLPFALA
jgi:hypothetical protein